MGIWLTRVNAASNPKDLSWACGEKVEAAQICLGMNRHDSLCSLTVCVNQKDEKP
jgi:hypothetical protein